MRNPFPKIKNDPARKGLLAAKKHLFGENYRYAIAPVYTRFDKIAWFVWDAEELDPGKCIDFGKMEGYQPDGRASLIRIEMTYDEAIRGLA